MPYGSNTAIYSANGINWTTTTISSSINCYSTCYGDGTIVAVGSSTKNVVYGTMEKENLKAVIDGYLTKSEIFDYIYPVGSVYISMKQTDPSTIFGGTWKVIDNAFLYVDSSGSGIIVPLELSSATTDKDFYYFTVFAWQRTA